MRLDELINMFIEDVCAGKTNETPVAYRSKLRHLEKFLGSDCASFDQKDIDRFRTNLLTRKTKTRGGKEIKEPLSRFTVRTILQTTRHFLNWGYQHGHISQIQLKNIKEPDADPKAIDPETIKKLISIAEQCGPKWEQARNIAILYVLRDTGGRVGSITHLEMDSIDFDRGVAFVPDKCDKTSTLRFNDQTLDAIRNWTAWRDQINPSSYALFIGCKGERLKRLGISRVLDRLAKAGNITGRHNPHSFRHAFARDALLAGADLSQVSQLLNHSGIAVTQKFYIRWSKNELIGFHRKYSPGRLLPSPGKVTAKP